MYICSHLVFQVLKCKFEFAEEGDGGVCVNVICEYYMHTHIYLYVHECIYHIYLYVYVCMYVCSHLSFQFLGANLNFLGKGKGGVCESHIRVSSEFNCKV